LTNPEAVSGAGAEKEGIAEGVEVTILAIVTDAAETLDYGP
jgi:hypothetical protein